MKISKYKIRTSDLRKTCNPSIFKFNTTEEIKPLRGIIGQDRAERAVSFGLDIDNPGYNIYLAGVFGTGKSRLARELVENKAQQLPVPADWCYVFNYKKPDCPKALQLKAGQGRAFQKDISVTIDEIIKNLVKTLESQDYEFKKNEIVNAFVEETNQMYLQLEEESRSYGFTISRNQNGVSSEPLKNGEPMAQEDYIGLSEEERTELMKKSRIVQEKLKEAFRKYKDLEKVTKENVKKLETDTAIIVITPYFMQLVDRYRQYQQVIDYLGDMQQDLLSHIDVFVEPEDTSSPLYIFKGRDKKAFLKRYHINLLIDNSSLQHAPVVIENNPTYANLFGQIEYEGEFGILATDFSKIKPGAIHKANGGYLILNMYDVAKSIYLWDKLKKVLKNREIVVESIGKTLGISNTETMEPEAIPVNIKIILIGDPFYYYWLYAMDEEFQKLFKIRADFDMEMERNRKHVNEYARFISSVCTSQNLRHFDPRAVAAVIDYGSRMADDKNKLTTLFNKLVEIIYEANCWASYDHSEVVSGKHVKKAIAEKRYRSSMMEDKTQEYIDKNILMISVSGKKVGELNGLAVYAMGDLVFGKPVRITAKTYMGEKGLVNIEREIMMSGSIHSKGVLTLSGYLGSQYAQDKPLSLSASLTFEQSYSGIEGDSASSAELYALLSSLAEVPISQGIAVTGSVNQNGEIQPVGGVNHKIEGYYKVCCQKGLTGQQGVIIPRQNVAQLMLDEEVVEAVRNKMFNIWAVDHIDQGIEILFNMTAGSRDKNGHFSPDSLHYLVDKKLRQWIENKKVLAGKSRPKVPGIGRKRGRR
ncbi:MAG: AAA family ATPase [Syntrophomonas sp.]